jgi:hypothetical protein
MAMQSSPIRGHVDRKLSRTASLSTLATPPGRQSGLLHGLADEFVQSLHLAYGSVYGVNNLDTEKLLQLREMTVIIKEKIEERISSFTPL